jgi:hypothetical protein
MQHSQSPADFSYVERERMVHSKINVDDEVKRGLSDFYWVYSWLNSGHKLLRNGVNGGAVLSAIAAVVEHPPSTTQGQVNSFKSGGAVDSYTEPTKNGTRTNYVQKYNAATMLHVRNGQKYHASPLASQGVVGSIVELEQAVLRMIGSNWCMPEYMISADASNNNYASILKAGSPFSEFISSLQGEAADEDEELLWKVLRISHQSGKFAYGYSWAEVKGAIEIQVETPGSKADDPEESTRINDTLNQRGLLSDRTWAAREGLDYEQEMVNGAKKAETMPIPYPQNRLAEAAKASWKDYA